MATKVNKISQSHVVAWNDLHLAIGLLMSLGKNIEVVKSLPAGYALALSNAYSELDSALSYFDEYRVSCVE